ncbi:MAG: HlyD family secretion protein [Nitratireductor sp.]
MNARVSKAAAAEAQPIKVEASSSGTASPGQPVRRPWRRVLMMALVPGLLLLGGGYYWLGGGRFEETENANLHLSRVAISSEVAGRVVSASVSDNHAVHEGDVLFEVDPEPFRIALAQAEAAVEGARLTVMQYRAAYQQALAQQTMAESELAFQQDNLARQEALSQKGVATVSSLDDARHNVQKASEQVANARQVVATAIAALGPSLDGPVDAHPSVAAAIAQREKAQYNLNAATVRAPADGLVYQSASFRPGQYVAPGVPLFTIVETGNSWIEANYKETQLENVKPGQSAEVVFDLLPDRKFRASVESVGAGTGAEFSILPAQNATGNWVKVTQRIPVRLTLDNEGRDIPLRSGMSATVTIDTEVSRHFGDLFAPARAAE